MLTINFDNIQPDKEISIRASELNWYLNPSMFHSKTLGKWLEVTNLWDRIHMMVQMAMLVSEEAWREETRRNVEEINRWTPWYRETEMKWFTWAAQSYIDLLPRKEDKSLLYKARNIETKRVVIINYMWYAIWFSWTADIDLYNEWNKWTMIDVKTSWGKWKQEWADEQRQKYYYTYLKCMIEWLEWCTFKYWVLTRQKNPQFQEFEYYITKEEAEQVLKDDLTLFIKWLWTEKKTVDIVVPQDNWWNVVIDFNEEDRDVWL